MIKRILPIAGPPVSGLMLVAAFPDYSLWPLAWVALVPLILGMRGVRPGWRCLQGYVFGMAFLGALFYWITFVRYPAGLGYLIFLIVFPVLFIPWAVLTGWALDAGKPWAALLVPACAWAVIEFGMSYGTFAFPWWSLAVSQAGTPGVSQVAAYTGMYGISFIVVMANVFFAGLISRKIKDNSAFWIVSGVMFAAVLAWGILAQAKWSAPQGAAVKVSLVQASFTQEEKQEAIKTGEDIESMRAAYWDMTDRAVKEHHPQIVVWPESVLPIELVYRGYYQPLTDAAVGEYGITLLTGVYDGLKNSVIAISPRKGLEGQYSKMQLVPFGEFVPYRNYFNRIPALKKWISAKIYDIDAEAGKKFHVFTTEHARFGAVICFESMVPRIPRRMARDGAEMLFVVTNDAWFLKSPAAAQHVALARLRAIENRRWLAQAANSGLSVIVNPAGRVVKTSGLFRREIVNGEMYPVKDKSFYTRHGDVFGVVCLIVLLAGIVVAWTGKRKLNAIDGSKSPS